MNDIADLYQQALAKHRNGDVSGAEQEYKAVLNIAPDHAGAWHFLGLVFHLQQRSDLALGHLETSLKLCDSKATFHNNYGVVLKDLHRFVPARSAFQRALELDPEYADAHANLGHVHLLLNAPEDAEISLRKALALQPQHPDAQRHLAELKFRQGNHLVEKEDFAAANRMFQEASMMSGGKPSWKFKSLSFCPTVFPDERMIARYWERLGEGLEIAQQADLPLDWRTLPTDGFIPSFHLPHHGRCCKDIRRQFAEIFASCFPQNRPVLKRKGRYRIGFHVFHGHEGGFIRGSGGIIERLDRKRFDVVILCPKQAVNHFRSEIHSDDVTYVPLDGPFEAVAQRTRDAACDLIYYRKVGSDPWSYFLPFTRPAPIQCTSYGTHGTSGVSAIDYFLSSSFVEPKNGQDYYTEKLFCLEAMPTFQHCPPPPENVQRSEFNLPSSGPLYFCPHRTSKYHPSFDPLLKEILDRDSSGHFILLTGRDPRGNEVLHERLRRNLGSDLLKRVQFFPALPYDQYLRLLSVSTMILDSPVYAGGLTSFDAFAYGIPEVTLSGPLHIQNFATGIYRRMGLDDLPCRTSADYVELALRLGKETEYRLDVHQRILERNHLIFEDVDTVPEHERFFETVLSRS